jgi:hypothetical protein
MATAHADAWPESGLRGERPTAPPRRTPPPPLPPLPQIGGRSRQVPAEARGRTPERGPADRRRPSAGSGERLRGERDPRDDVQRSRPPAPRRPADPHRGRGPVRDERWADDEVRPRRPDADRPAARRPGAERPAPESGSRVRGVLAVLGVLFMTAAGGAADWFMGGGLGMITLVVLVAATSIATLVVRRRDVLSVVLCPPLVFVAVAGINIGLSPGVSLTLPTVATILIRGFPTMAVATGAAVVLGLVRLLTRR